MASETRSDPVAAAQAAVSALLDPHDVALIEQNLRLTPEQRLEQLVRTVRFIQAAREALARTRG